MYISNTTPRPLLFPCMSFPGMSFKPQALACGWRCVQPCCVHHAYQPLWCPLSAKLLLLEVFLQQLLCALTSPPFTMTHHRPLSFFSKQKQKTYWFLCAGMALIYRILGAIEHFGTLGTAKPSSFNVNHRLKRSNGLMMQVLAAVVVLLPLLAPGEQQLSAPLLESRKATLRAPTLRTAATAVEVKVAMEVVIGIVASL